MLRAVALARGAVFEPALGALLGCRTQHAQLAASALLHGSAAARGAAAAEQSKKPSTAYHLFMKDYFQQHPKDPNNKLSAADRMSQVSQAYKELAEKDKQRYQQQAQALKQAYDEAQARIKEQDKAKKEAKAAKSRNGVYPQFVKANYQEVRKENPSITHTEVFVKIAEVWRQMSAAQKAEFTTKLAKQAKA